MAHNLKVVGSNPTPATKKLPRPCGGVFYCRTRYALRGLAPATKKPPFGAVFAFGKGAGVGAEVAAWRWGALFHNRRGQIGAFEVGFGDFGVRHVGAFQNGLGQLCAFQVGAGEIYVAEIRWPRLVK